MHWNYHKFHVFIFDWWQQGARVKLHSADKESLIFPSEDNFISFRRAEINFKRSSTLAGIYTGQFNEKTNAARTTRVHVPGCLKMIYEEISLLYIISLIKTQPSLSACWWKSISSDSLSAWNIKSALFAAAATTWQLRRAHYGLLFLKAVRGWKSKCLCEWARARLWKMRSNTACARVDHTSHSVSDKREFSWSAFSTLRNAKEMPRVRCALFFDLDWLIKECLMNWEAYNIWLTNRLSDELWWKFPSWSKCNFVFQQLTTVYVCWLHLQTHPALAAQKPDMEPLL